eukprot:4250651-Alexandrium_andersonii.AAC.1
MWDRAWRENGENWDAMFGFCEESGESRNRAERKRRDRMIDLLLEAMDLHPSLSDAELFELAQARGGAC